MRFVKPVALVALLAGISFGSTIARANGVETAITPNQPVTGSVSGEGVDSYSFTVSNGKSFLVTIAETGAHSEAFVPVVTLHGPGNYDTGEGHPLGETLSEVHPADGAWTIAVSAMAGPSNVGGGYRLTLVQAPFNGAGTLSSTPTSGTTVRDQVNVHTFTGTAGHNEALSIAATGGEGFMPQTFVFSPAGELIGNMTCAACEGTVQSADAGTYAVVVTKGDPNDVTGTYSISVQEQN
jgi:hypothetical protein